MPDGSERTERPAAARRAATVALGLAAALAWFGALTTEGIEAPGLGAAAMARLSVSGVVARAAAAPRLHLFPVPRLEFGRVELTEPGGRFHARLPATTARLDLLALLIGRVELAELRLRRPRFVVHTADGESGPTLSALAPPARRLRIERGAGLWRRGAVAEELASAIDLDIRWASADHPLAVDGAATWRGARVSFAGWLARPPALREGGESPARLVVDSSLFRMTFEGAVGGERSPGAIGRLSAATPSLSALSRALRLSLPLPGGRDDATLKAQITSRNRTLSLADVELSLGPNAFEGSLSLRRDAERPSLAGTLASTALLVDDWTAAAPPVVAPDGRWSADPIGDAIARDLDLDLRISAAQARLGPLDFDETALSLQLRRERLEISLGEAAGYGGEFRGRLVVVGGRRRLETRGALQWTGIDAAAFLKRIAPRNRLTGSANGQISFESAGASFADLVAGLDGRAQATLRAGELGGLDLEAALRRRDRRALPNLVKAQTGRTAFDLLHVSLRSQRGQALIEDSAMRGPGARAAFRGLLDLPGQTLSLHVEAAQTGATGNRLSFYLAGPWRRLRVLADAEPSGAPAVSPPR